MGRTSDGRPIESRDLVYQNLYMPRGTSRRLAQTMLTMHAEYGGWGLDRLRLYSHGARRRGVGGPPAPPSTPMGPAAWCYGAPPGRGCRPTCRSEASATGAGAAGRP